MIAMTLAASYGACARRHGGIDYRTITALGPPKVTTDEQAAAFTKSFSNLVLLSLVYYTHLPAIS